jgi:microcystin-dependent protein
MPRNSSGVYVQPASDVNPPVSGTVIDPVAVAAAFVDFGNEITNSLDRLGRAPMQAVLQMGAFRISNVGQPVAQNDAARLADFGSYLPAGAVQLFAMSTAPAGWLICDGTSYLTATYPALFAAIAYTYGGSGANFNVPDYRGAGLRIWDNGKGLDPSRVFGSYQVDSFASHTHTQNAHTHGASDSGHAHLYAASGSAVGTSVGGNNASQFGSASTGTGFAAITVGNATAVNNVTGGTETTMKNNCLQACIRT